MQNKNSHTLFDFMYPSGTNELWQDIVGYEDGGFVGYQYGGGATAEQILADQGLTATPEQLALFADMDTTQIEGLVTGLRDTIATGGKEGALQDVKSGFGDRGITAHTQSQQRKGSEKALSTGIQQAQTAFESDTLSTAAGIVAGGGEFGKVAYSGPTGNEGWPNIQAYDSWVAAGRPEPAVQYGFGGEGDPNISPGGAGDYSSKQSPYG